MTVSPLSHSLTVFLQYILFIYLFLLPWVITAVGAFLYLYRKGAIF